MRRKIKKSTKILLACLFLLIVLNYLKTDFSKVTVLQDDFLINFLLATIGIFLAILALLYGVVDKIKKIFIDNNIEKSLNNISNAFSEIKDNTLCILYIMISIFLISIISGFDIPYICLKNYAIKNVFLYNLKLILLILAVIAIHDTVKTFFIILNISNFKK